MSNIFFIEHTFFFRITKLIQVDVFTNAMKLNMFSLTVIQQLFNNTFVFWFHYKLPPTRFDAYFIYAYFCAAEKSPLHI
jgi:hypothetical protein